MSQNNIKPLPDSSLVNHAMQILKSVPLIDGHNDTLWQYLKRVNSNLDLIDLGADTSRLEPAMRTDIPRLRKGCVGAQWWAVYLPEHIKGKEALAAVREQVGLFTRMIRRYADVLERAGSTDEIRKVFANGKIASLLGVEGGYAIEDSIEILSEWYEFGIRYLTLTCSKNTRWADAATDTPEHHGLTTFGKALVEEMNRLGILVDLSHAAQRTVYDVLEVTHAPVIFSHSSAHALTPHPRNVSDDILQQLAENKGIVMVTFVPKFVAKVHNSRASNSRAESGSATGLSQATLSDVADHIDHIVEVAGIDHVGIGSDFDGFLTPTTGLEDVSNYPALFAELLRRGYSEDALKKIAGLNFLRVFENVEKIAHILNK